MEQRLLGLEHKEGRSGKGEVVRKGGARDHRGASHSRLTGLPLTVGLSFETQFPLSLSPRISIYANHAKPGMVAHAYNHSTPEVAAGRLVWDT